MMITQSPPPESPIEPRPRNILEALAELERDIAEMHDLAPFGKHCVDDSGTFLSVNALELAWLGYTKEEVVGTRKFVEFLSPASREKFIRYSSVALGGDEQPFPTLELLRRNGTKLPVIFVPVANAGISPAERARGALIFDLTEIRECDLRPPVPHPSVFDEIAFLAYHDSLTRLPNRSLLQDRLEQALAAARRSGKQGAVLLVDLDGFKTINDSRGHDIGDRVLVEVARRLLDVVRETDTVGRLGGDEFLLVLEALHADPESAARKAQAVGEKVLAVLAQPYVLDVSTFFLTASIGADVCSNAASGSQLLQHADLAMYQAKKAGRNTLRFFEDEMQSVMNQHIVIRNELRTAIEEEQFVLYYQPQVTHGQRIVGVEALLRWQHPRHGILLPAQFVAVAEETGLIVPIGHWVLQAACAQLKAWESRAGSAASGIRLSINVSAREFNDPLFLECATSVLAGSAIDTSRIVFELTESVVLDVHAAVAKMNELGRLGVQFSIDDFGTGYSSLSSLTKLPLHQLKIDGSFIRNIGLRPDDEGIVQTIISLARVLGIEVVAEGVETSQQHDFLEDHGCRLFQGYLYGRPVPIGEFEALLAHIGDLPDILPAPLAPSAR